jgi:hypothetical protein
VTTTKTSQHANTTAAPTARTQAMLDGRHADSARRQQRVIAALNRALTDGAEINISGIARTAGVDRSFLYRHRDLLEKIHALAAEPPAGQPTGPAVTRTSLQADLLAAHERAARLHARIQQLERRLSEALGQQAWGESGLGAPPDIDALNQKVTHLEQQILDPRCRSDTPDTARSVPQGCRRRPRRSTTPPARRAPPPAERASLLHTSPCWTREEITTSTTHTPAAQQPLLDVEDGPKGARDNASQREVVDLDYLQRCSLWIGRGSDRPQQRVAADRHAELSGHPCTGAAGQRRADRLQHRAQQRRAARVSYGRTIDLLHECLGWTAALAQTKRRTRSRMLNAGRPAARRPGFAHSGVDAAPHLPHALPAYCAEAVICTISPWQLIRPTRAPAR